MQNLLAKGSAWLEGQRRRHCTEEVTYLRGDSSVSVRATIGRTNHELAEAEGLRTVVESRDYLVHAADLTLDDIEVEPETGDRIIEGELDGGQVYEVMHPAGGPPWRWSDQFRTVRRIHTKYVGPTPPAP